ncbi:MAG: O-antigen ligase family protein [Solirubrobacteraceae bacterium]
MILTVTWNGVKVGGGLLVDPLTAFAFACVCMHVTLNRRTVTLPTWLLLAGVGLVLAALLTVIFPPRLELLRNPTLQLVQATGGAATIPARSNIGSVLKFEVALILFPLMIAAVATTPRRCSRLADLWAISALISAATGVADFAGVVHLVPVPYAPPGREAGLAFQANHLALTCAMALPITILWSVRSMRWRCAAWLGASVLLGGVYASGSRAGTVGAVGAVVTTVAAVPRLRRWLGVTLPVAGIGVILLLSFTSAGAQIISHARLNSGNANALLSNGQRDLVAQTALDDIRARPIEGVGFTVIDDAHDIYLQLLASGGVIALAAFAAFCAGLIKSSRLAFGGTQRDEAIALAIAVVVWLVSGLVDNQVADRYLYVAPALLVAMAGVAVGRGGTCAPTPALLEPTLILRRLRPREWRQVAARGASRPSKESAPGRR